MSDRILVVDDELSIRETFEHHLGRAGYTVRTEATGEAALAGAAEFDPQIVITDVRLPGMSGIEVLEILRDRRPDVDVVVITAHEDMQTAVAAMRAGATDYLVKPLDLDQIHMVLERCLREQRLRRRAATLADEAAQAYGMHRLVGRHPRMIEIYKIIGTLARNRATVLVRGETGTGKELIARAIHYASPAAGEPFLAINCSALPDTLLESELFGHVRGAFTGAMTDRRGRFELAGSGTLFLDEIGDTTPAFQTKLLRVLQEREFHPLGSERARTTDARVMAATHRPLEMMVREETFREDLYYRLNVVQITVPPLRERTGDLPLLIEYQLARLASELHLSGAALTPQALRVLCAHHWPGNVRELENVLTRALVAARNGLIDERHIALGSSARGVQEHIGGDVTLADLERDHVRAVLDRVGGHKRRACRILGVSRPRLDRIIARHNLQVTTRDHGGHDQ